MFNQVNSLFLKVFIHLSTPNQALYYDY